MHWSMSALCQLLTCAPSRTASSLDHLVGGHKKGRWCVEPERLRCFKVQRGLKLVRRLHREVGRLVAAQDTVDIQCRLPTRIDKIDT